MSIQKYSKEFKLDAISLVAEQGYTQIAAARSLGISPKLISERVRKHAKDQDQAFRGSGRLTEEQLEIRRLREENKRLKMEKDILKKATAFFAKEMN